MKFKKHRFDRVVITKEGRVIFLPPVIKHYKGKNIYELDQWMGAGKSVVGMEHLGRVHARGGTIMANMAVGYMPHNQGKPKEQWTPNIQSLDDLKSVNNCTILIDDFKKIVQRWQCSEAVFIGMVANESRKDKKDILITAQRVTNFIPKDIREVCTNYEIPYVTIRDQRVESPDGMGMPAEIEVFNVSATGSFLGFGIWNGFFPDGKVLIPTKKMLDQYSTLEVVTDLKAEGENPNKPGYALEEEFETFITKNLPEEEWIHCNQDGVFDFVSKTNKYAFDVKGIGEDGRVRLDSQPDLTRHLSLMRTKGHDGYIVIKTDKSWGFRPITYTLNAQVKGKKIPLKYFMKGVRSFKSIFGRDEV